MTSPPLPVIIVDDDGAVRNSLKFSLELEGLHVLAYASGAELLGAPLPDGIGCIVLDHYMPQMNGLDLLAQLRRRGESAPAILITGRLTEDLRRAAERGGIFDVIEKPLHDGALLTSIHGALALAPAVPATGRSTSGTSLRQQI